MVGIIGIVCLLLYHLEIINTPSYLYYIIHIRTKYLPTCTYLGYYI